MGGQESKWIVGGTGYGAIQRCDRCWELEGGHSGGASTLAQSWLRSSMGGGYSVAGWSISIALPFPLFGLDGPALSCWGLRSRILGAGAGMGGFGFLAGSVHPGLW